MRQRPDTRRHQRERHHDSFASRAGGSRSQAVRALNGRSPLASWTSFSHSPGSGLTGKIVFHSNRDGDFEVFV